MLKTLKKLFRKKEEEKNMPEYALRIMIQNPTLATGLDVQPPKTARAILVAFQCALQKHQQNERPQEETEGYSLWMGEKWMEIQDFADSTFNSLLVAPPPLDEAEQELSKLFGILLEGIVNGTATESLEELLKATVFIERQYYKKKKELDAKKESLVKRREAYKKTAAWIAEWILFYGSFAAAIIYCIVQSWSFRSMDAATSMVAVPIVLLIGYIVIMLLGLMDKTKKARLLLTAVAGIGSLVATWHFSQAIERAPGTYFIISKRDNTLVDIIQFHQCNRSEACPREEKYFSFIDNTVVEGYPLENTVNIAFNGGTIVIPYTINKDSIHYYWILKPVEEIEGSIQKSTIKFLANFAEKMKDSHPKRNIQIEVKEGELLSHFSVDAKLRKEIEQDETEFLNRLSDHLNQDNIWYREGGINVIIGKPSFKKEQ